jgi:hypothetical protein
MGFTNNMVKIKELIDPSSLSLSSSSSSEPYSLFLYAMNSPVPEIERTLYVGPDKYLYENNKE